MNFSEKQLIKKEEYIFSVKRRFYNRIHLDVLCFHVFLVLSAVIFLGACLAGAVRGVFESAPVVTEEEILSDGLESVLYDRTGAQIQTLNEEGREKQYVSLQDVSEAAQNAIVATTDQRYYEHHGMDIRGFIQSLFGQGDLELENSTRTLSQQLLLNQVFADKKMHSIYDQFSHTIQKQYLAIQMEKNMGKDKILECYLNTLYFGENLVGIEAASQYYFMKPASDLTASEAAVLAAVGEDCEEYDPIFQQAANRRMRAKILENMLNMEVLTEEEYEDALGEDVYLELQGVVNRKSQASRAEDYYVDAVVSQVVSDLMNKEGYSQTQAYHAVYQEGLKIYTCLDSEIQSICENEVNTVMKKYDGKKPLQVSFVLMDQKSGKVKALIGGYKKDSEKIYVNRAIDFLREPGSALSLLSVWLPALDTGGQSLGTVKDDNCYTYALGGVSDGNKSSVGTKGLVTMRESISQSLLTPAVKTLEEIDVQTGYDYLKNVGISTLVDKKEDTEGNVLSDINLSLASGQLVNGVTVLELTSAYAALANGGTYVEPVFYSKVIDKDGNVLLETDTEGKKVIKDSSAWLITDVLQKIVSEGEASEADFGGEEIPTAGICAVSENRADMWFEGYTPYYTAGIWCGYDDGSSVKAQVPYQVLWSRIMKKVHSTKKLVHSEFSMPSDIVSCEICTKCGKLAQKGLCDNALGGSTVATEYFVRGTQPKTGCDCHVKYYVCPESGELSTEKCPKEEARVYLMKEESSETEDSAWVLPKNFAKHYCELHSQ